MAQRKKGLQVNSEVELSVKLKPVINESGEELYEAPIPINGREDLANYHITWEDCKTLHFGNSEGVCVYFFPTTNRELAEGFWKMLNSEHSREYRKNRCLIPGKLKPLIVCPDTNKCSKCPYPDCRDKHQANTVSWEGLIQDGYDVPDTRDEKRESEIRMELDEVCELIRQKNPKYLLAIKLKEYYGLSVSEIAEKLNETERNVYYYIKRATEIGKLYKENNKDE